MKTFALALGGGGARGLAHIPVMEALEELEVKPVAIAGTSIGALVGSAYAAGMSAKEMRRYMLSIAHSPAETRRRLLAARAGTLTDLLSGAFSLATQMDAEKFCAQFLPEAIPEDFATLAIPTTVMTTDLHRRQQAPLSSGLLRPALAAAIAIPGIFRPVAVDGRVLIDGGTTNPLPFDLLRGLADVIVAVDVLTAPPLERSDVPGTWEALYVTINIMGSAIIASKLEHTTPDLLIRPNVAAFRTLDFYQATSILRTAEPIKTEVIEKLGALLSD
jgi:NTE family protein